MIGRPTLVRYGAATLSVAIATLLTSLLWLIVDRPVSTPIFLAAIALVTWAGGLRLGIYTAALTSVVFEYFYISPYREYAGWVDLILRLVVFFVQGCFLAWLAERLRVAIEEISDSREELRALSLHQQTLREAEQTRIAREIHDELGQALTSLKLDLHLVKKEVGALPGNVPKENVVDEIDEMSKRIDETIGTVRRISSEIRPSILDDFGLVAAMEWQARQFERKTGVECVFRSSSENIDIEPDAGSAVFRIFQEALTNIARHANASKVRILIDAVSDRIRMSIEDDGVGVDLQQLARSRSLGIMGMKERARLIGADLSIESSDEGGTRVEVVLPAVRAARAGVT